MEITVTDKICLVNGVPELFATPRQAVKHRDSWIHTPLDVNLEANYYADAEDHSDDPTINYDCVAWS